MRTLGFRLLAVGVLLCAAAACEKKSRTRNSEGSGLLTEADMSPSMTPITVYRFVSVDQSLIDARRAVAEEKWGEAYAAADALLKKQPNQPEAQKLADQAKLEGPAQVRFLELNKAILANDLAKVVKAWNGLPDGSIYRARGQADYDRIHGAYVDAQEGETRAMVRIGRCDEARRVARVTIDLFPESRARLEDAQASCRPVRSEPSPSEVAAEKDKEKRAEMAAARGEAKHTEAAKPEPVALGMAPLAPVTAPGAAVVAAGDVSKGVAADPGKAPVDAAKVAAAGGAAAPPTPGAPPDGYKQLLPPEAPAAAPRAAVAPKIVPLAELEPLRLAGEPRPALPNLVKTLAEKDGQKLLMVALTVCLSEAGAPTSVSLKRGTDYPDANQKIVAEVHKWRFRPYQVNGQKVPVCTSSVLQYKLVGLRTCGPRGNVGNNCAD
jgi:hypothetical protein